jgi:hypothetical protein
MCFDYIYKYIYIYKYTLRDIYIYTVTLDTVFSSTYLYVYITVYIYIYACVHILFYRFHDILLLLVLWCNDSGDEHIDHEYFLVAKHISQHLADVFQHIWRITSNVYPPHQHHERWKLHGARAGHGGTLSIAEQAGMELPQIVAT